jgi:all-trans-8'-apo-beta-carotenal 15,15'-oxygenase
MTNGADGENIVTQSAGATSSAVPRAPLETLLHTYKRATATVEAEHRAVPLRVLEGSVPHGLRGVLYRNGPGTMQSFGQPYQHPFDGDGMVTRFSFEADGVRYTNRFVQTEERRNEARAGRMLYRSFGTNLPGGLRRNVGRLAFKNAANTSVLLEGGTLLALWEGGLPHALDPVTLATLGPYDYEGRLRNNGSRFERLLSPVLPFSAHPKRDVDTGELVNFGTLVGARPRLVLYGVDRHGAMRAPRFVPLDELSFVHDFVLTRRYAVFFLPSVAFDLARTFLGRTTPVGSLRARPTNKASLLLVPRDGGAPRSFEVDAGFVFHVVNGFEDERGHVVVDALRMSSLPAADDITRFLAGEPVDVPQAHPTRFMVDTNAGRVTEERRFELPAELPSIDPRSVGRPYEAFWSLAGQVGEKTPFLTRVARLEMASRTQITREFSPDLPGEPLFVRDPQCGETRERGWVLVVVYRAATHRSELLVLDADTLASVCRLELPHHVPPGFHGTWVAAASQRSA